MCLSRNWLAVIRRTTLEIYLTPAYTKSGFTRWRVLPFAHLVGSCTFSEPLDHTTLPGTSVTRFCISCDDGIIFDPVNIVVGLRCSYAHVVRHVVGCDLDSRDYFSPVYYIGSLQPLIFTSSPVTQEYPFLCNIYGTTHLPP